MTILYSYFSFGSSRVPSGPGCCRLHFHLVPKYEGQFEWGGVFQMNPGRTYLAQEEYDEIIEKIKQAL